MMIEGRDIYELSSGEVVDWMNVQRRARGKYRLRDATAALWLEILRVFADDGPPMTVRQVFYALETRGHVRKTEQGAARVGYHVLRMRRCGVLPYAYVADNTRWMRKPPSYSSLEAYLMHGRDAYRRALWDEQAAYVEVWCEKDALAGVLHQVTARWDVPLMVTRGYPSETFVWEAAEQLKVQRKPSFLYYFGDWDPSGTHIPENTAVKLRDFGADFHFEVVAVLPWQIEEWNLPTRPTKRTDTRAKDWSGGSVELDAISAKVLRKLAREAIEGHVDPVALERTRRVEEAERETYKQVVKHFEASPTF